MYDDRSFVSELFLRFVYLTDEFDEAFAGRRHALLRPVSELELSHGPALPVLRINITYQPTWSEAAEAHEN